MNRHRLQQFLTILKWPLPKRPGLYVATILCLAALPLAPLELLPLEPMQVQLLAFVAIGLSSFALLDRGATALLIAVEAGLAIRARRFGLQNAVSGILKEMISSPFLGFAQLFVTVVSVGCVVVLSVSAVTYSFTNHLAFKGPFGVIPSRLDVILYFADEAIRGMAFRFLDILGIEVPNKLQINRNGPFAVFVWGYHLTMFALTVQVIWLAIRLMREKIDPYVETVLAPYREKATRLEELISHDEWHIIKSEQARNGGWLTKEQRSRLEARLVKLYDLEQKVYNAGALQSVIDDFESALRRDDDATEHRKN
jgi:hypothetical protein